MGTWLCAEPKALSSSKIASAAPNVRLQRQRESWKPRLGSWVRLSNLQPLAGSLHVHVILRRARHLEGSLGEVVAFNSSSGYENSCF